jgi:hypothetical protein
VAVIFLTDCSTFHRFSLSIRRLLQTPHNEGFLSFFLSLVALEVSDTGEQFSHTDSTIAISSSLWMQHAIV